MRNNRGSPPAGEEQNWTYTTTVLSRQSRCIPSKCVTPLLAGKNLCMRPISWDTRTTPHAGVPSSTPRSTYFDTTGSSAPLCISSNSCNSIGIQSCMRHAIRSGMKQRTNRRTTITLRCSHRRCLEPHLRCIVVYTSVRVALVLLYYAPQRTHCGYNGRV